MWIDLKWHLEILLFNNLKTIFLALILKIYLQLSDRDSG